MANIGVWSAGRVGFACLGGTSIAIRREGFWSDEELAHLFGFCLISLYHGAMAATRRGLPACLLFVGLGTLVSFWGCISGCCGGTRFLVLLKLFQGIFSWFGFGKASGIGSGRV